MKIILDTSTIITAFIGDNSSFSKDIIKLLNQDKIQCFICADTIDELKLKSRSTKLLKLRNFKRQEIEEFIIIYQQKATFIELKDNVKFIHSRDPKDDVFMALATQIEADFIISVDKDLLCLKSVGNTKIIRPNEYFTLP
jgi:putative PIN family toxin of toxin-antitoxin system